MYWLKVHWDFIFSSLMRLFWVYETHMLRTYHYLVFTYHKYVLEVLITSHQGEPSTEVEWIHGSVGQTIGTKHVGPC